MSASSLRVLLISSDSGLRDRLRETLDQIPGKTYSVEWVDSFREAMGALTRQEYDIYFVALNGGQDEAAAILQQAPARSRAKPIIFLSEHMSPEVRCELLRTGASGCLRQDQLTESRLIQ
jgi:DNA-binding response OmpR family regulator